MKIITSPNLSTRRPQQISRRLSSQGPSRVINITVRDKASNETKALSVLAKLLLGGHPLAKSNLKKLVKDALGFKSPVELNKYVALADTTFDSKRSVILDRMCKAVGLQSWNYLLGVSSSLEAGQRRQELTLNIKMPPTFQASASEPKRSAKKSAVKRAVERLGIEPGRNIRLSVQIKGTSDVRKAHSILQGFFKEHKTTEAAAFKLLNPSATRNPVANWIESASDNALHLQALGKQKLSLLCRVVGLDWDELVRQASPHQSGTKLTLDVTPQDLEPVEELQREWRALSGAHLGKSAWVPFVN